MSATLQKSIHNLAKNYLAFAIMMLRFEVLLWCATEFWFINRLHTTNEQTYIYNHCKMNFVFHRFAVMRQFTTITPQILKVCPLTQGLFNSKVSIAQYVELTVVVFLYPFPSKLAKIFNMSTKSPYICKENSSSFYVSSPHVI